MGSWLLAGARAGRKSQFFDATKATADEVLRTVPPLPGHPASTWWCFVRQQDGVQRLLHAHKRRGAGAPFCDLSGRKIGGDCSQKGAMGEQSGEEAPLHSIGRGLRSQCGAGDYSGRKFRPRPHTPSARTCTRWGGEIRFFLLPAFAWGLQWPFRTPQGARWPVVWSGCGSEGVAS